MIHINDHDTSHLSEYLYASLHCIQIFTIICEVTERHEEDYAIELILQRQTKPYKE